MVDNAEKLQQVKSMVRSVLLSVKEGVPAARLQRDYEEMVGEAIPFRKLGFSSFENFVLGIRDVVRIDRRGGDVICHGVHDDSTAHIKKLVSKQRSKTVMKPARRPRGGGSSSFINRAPPPRRPPLLHAPPTPRHYAPRHGIPTFISPPMNVGQRTPGMTSGGNKYTGVKTYVNSAWKKRAMSQARTPQISSAPSSQSTNVPVRRPYRPSSNRTELATSIYNPEESWDDEVSAYNPEESWDDEVSTNKPIESWDYEGSMYKTGKEAEGAAVRRAMLELQQDPSTAIYNPEESWDDEVSMYKTGKEAEGAAARRAMLELQQDPSTDNVETGKSNLSSELQYKIKSRVKEILENKTNGLWNTRIPHLYKEIYNEVPPPDLLDLIKLWTDIAIVEIRETVYPVLEDPCMKLKIPKTQLIQYNEEVFVYVAYTYNPGSFFVQRTDSCIDIITEQLQRHCKTVGPPAAQHLEKGKYCAGIFSEDGKWTRAEIIQTKSDGTVQLLFVDYGNVEFVKTQDLRWLSPELAEYPYQAINCCLYGIQPLEGENDWSSASTDMFYELVYNEVLLALPGQICDGIRKIQLLAKSNLRLTVSDRLASAKLVQLRDEVIPDVNDDSLHSGIAAKS